MNKLKNLYYKITGGSNLDKTIYNELNRYSKKYDPAEKFFIGAYELHLFTGIELKKVRRALQSLERQGRITARPRFLNGVRLNSLGYAINN